MIQVPDGWEIIQLGKLGSFKNGVNKSKEDFGFGVPFINLQDVFGHWEIQNSNFDLVNVTEEEVKNYNLRKGDILFIRSSVKPSGVGLTSLIKEDILNTTYSGFIIRFRLKDKFFDIDYTKYCFHDEFFRQRLLQKSTVSANSNINQESLVTLDLLLPPIKEQEKIAKILSTLDKAIETTNQLIEKEKNIKTALMQELLTNGIDEKGQIRTPQTHKYKQSELGLIPNEWEIISLNGISSKISDGIHTTPIYSDSSDFYFINGNNLENGKIIITDKTNCVDKEEYNKYKLELTENTILLSINGTIGNFAFYKNEKVVLGKSATYIICKNNIDIQFISFLLSSDKILQSFELSLTGSTIKNLSIKAIKETKIIYPSIEEQEKIAKILNTQNKKIEAEDKNISKLKELKKGLMSDLLSGKVRVKL